MAVIDPSIITSGNQMAAPQMPNFNAMMQTRTAGLENIYNMERQRQADAQAAQKDQADQQLKALMPALASAFADPSDDGLAAALTMTPPEYADMAQQQIDQLKSIPDVGQRKNVLRAWLSQFDSGRTLITQLEPSAGARLQSGLEQQRIDLEKAKLAAASTPEGGIDPKTKAKFDQAYPKAVQSLQFAVTGLDKDIADVQALIDDPGLKDISGVYGSSTPNVSAQANRAQALYDKIKAGAGLTALTDLKSASPNGGALGNVSNQEGQKLENSVAAFSQKQDYVTLRRVLHDYLVDLKVSRENVQSAFDETYSYKGENPSADIVSGVVQRRQRIEQETPAVAAPAPASPGAFRILKVR